MQCVLAGSCHDALPNSAGPVEFCRNSLGSFGRSRPMGLTRDRERHGKRLPPDAAVVASQTFAVRGQKRAQVLVPPSDEGQGLHYTARSLLRQRNAAAISASTMYRSHSRSGGLAGGVGRDGPVVGEQRPLDGTLAGPVEDVQGLPPSRLLGVVDLPQVQDRALGDVVALDAAASEAAILDDAEVAVRRAVLPTLMRSQEHAGIVRPSPRPDKGPGLHCSPPTRPPDGTAWTCARKSCENSSSRD